MILTSSSNCLKKGPELHTPLILLFAVPVFLLSFSGCNKCAFQVCDECHPDFSNSTNIINFNSTPGNYIKSELDSFYLLKIDTSGSDTSFSKIKNPDYSSSTWNIIRAGWMGNINLNSINDFTYIIMLKDSSKSFYINEFYTRFEPEDKDACCDCDKYILESLRIDSILYARHNLPISISK